MDWNYISSLSLDDIADDEKDELYNTIAWYDCESENLSRTKCTTLFKLSQELLKHKGEQVEVLLHKLDELATEQGEHEIVKLDVADMDGRSSKSRKSSSIEFENLEQKYLVLKGKYKKQMKLNDNNLTEINKLNKKITSLEQEKIRLINETSASHEDDKSESSDSAIKEEHKELVKTVHTKNKQISDLLRDIEEVERENEVLRKKLTDVRDDLATATKELTSLTDTLAASKIELKDSSETIATLTATNEALRDDYQDVLTEKSHLEEKMLKFTADVNVRVDEWKNILDAKEKLLQESKAQQGPYYASSNSTPSPTTCLPHQHEQNQISALSTILNQRDRQLEEMKSQLHGATNEMEECTDTIEKLKLERDECLKKNAELSCSVKELKKHLKSSHARCQDLQENVVYAEKFAESKDQDLRDIVEKLKTNSTFDISDSINELQKLKGHNRVQEKEIISLVRASNKLQDICDQFEKENEILKDRLGLTSDDEITGISTKRKQQKKDLQHLKGQLNALEEELLDVKSQNHKLHQTIAALSNQLLDLGEKPDDSKTDDRVNKMEIKELSEANEFLARKESTVNEDKFDTIDELMRALDVKNIAGSWYHPAMRLQADLHKLQGINAELREQLRVARLEVKPEETVVAALEDIRQVDDNVNSMTNDEIPTSDDIQTITEIYNNLQSLMMKINPDVDLSSKFNAKSYKMNLATIKEQLLLVYDQYSNDKETLTDQIRQFKLQIDELQQLNEINEAKLTVLTDNPDDNMVKLLQLTTDNVSFNRKRTYLENQITKLNNIIAELNKEQSVAKIASMTKIEELSRKITSLSTTVEILTNNLNGSVDSMIFQEIQTNLDSLTIKHRNFLNSLNQLKGDKSLELQLFEKSQKLLQEENSELKDKIADLSEKLYRSEIISGSSSAIIIDANIETLTEKIAQSEVNEISERQRANHINNLYELVKEQLQKSDERFTEFEKYNKDILQKNLLLQEHLKIAENKLCNYIETNVYQQLQVDYNKLLKQNENLTLSLSRIDEEFRVFRETSNTNHSWNSGKEQELLCLKHQIVDLQAVSDEKMLLTQVGNDLACLRLQEVESRKRIDYLTSELSRCERECQNLANQLDQSRAQSNEKELVLKQKMNTMQDILINHKVQYLGSVPLILDEFFIDNLIESNHYKHEMYQNLYKSQLQEIDCVVLKEQYENEIQIVRDTFGNMDDVKKKVLNWHQEKKLIQLNEIKYRRQSELKEKQLQHIFEKVQMQDDQIVKLEEEIITLHRNYNCIAPESDLPPNSGGGAAAPASVYKVTKAKEIQTDAITIEDDNKIIHNVSDEEKVSSLHTELVNVTSQLAAKDQLIEQLKNKITEQEMNISLFRKQIGDKQSQLSFYEKHILELQNKKEEIYPGTTTAPVVATTTAVTNEETRTLKFNINTLQDHLKQREDAILKYQSLLKNDRDKHSMAAALMQEELQMLQKCLSEEKQKCFELQKVINESYPSKAAMEQYFLQVHALEGQLSELRTTVSGLESQLQASREEAVRWRSLAHDRLESMQKLGKDLEELHNNEILVYKNDSEKWNEEVVRLKQMISKYRGEMGHEFDFQKLLKEKDDRIHELNVMVRLTKNASRKQVEKSDSESMSKLTDLEAEYEHLQKDHKTLKKNYEQLLNREKNARDEIRDLRGKLLKKPILSARSDKNDKSIKEQLQKKITTLENEIVELKENLDKQIALNDSHRIKISEDFDRWNKQKHWQQTAEKLKIKLKEKEVDCEKIQQTCQGYRILIEKMEREKYNLENKIKILKNNQKSLFDAGGGSEVDMLRMENMKLLAENEALISKLEMQQHHSGGLGAAMLQEKLEAQERKIAVMELSTKGNVEIRSELERHQNLISNLQKTNLCLEAENLEMKLDLGKYSKEMPHLRDQIHHLENYIEVLKKENASQETPHREISGSESKKLSELERTVFILKRVVEKLQAENKRLLSGKRPCLDRSSSDDKLKNDFFRLKEQYCESLKKISLLEKDLNVAVGKVKTYENKPVMNNSVLSDELVQVKEQLEQKSHWLDKVKVLLHRAALREKALLQQIAEFKGDEKESTENTE